MCIGYSRQGFGRGKRGYRTSLRSFWKLPSCPIEPMPASCKTVLPLPKVKPSNDNGSISGITDLKRGKSYRAEAIVAGEERSENM